MISTDEIKNHSGFRFGKKQKKPNPICVYSLNIVNEKRGKIRDFFLSMIYFWTNKLDFSLPIHHHHHHQHKTNETNNFLIGFGYQFFFHSLTMILNLFRVFFSSSSIIIIIIIIIIRVWYIFSERKIGSNYWIIHFTHSLISLSLTHSLNHKIFFLFLFFCNIFHFKILIEGSLNQRRKEYE